MLSKNAMRTPEYVSKRINLLYPGSPISDAANLLITDRAVSDMQDMLTYSMFNHGSACERCGRSVWTRTVFWLERETGTGRLSWLLDVQELASDGWHPYHRSCGLDAIKGQVKSFWSVKQ